MRRAADEQVAQARQDAERDQAGLRAGLEAQIAAAEEARAGLQARAERPRLMRWTRVLRRAEAEARLAGRRGRPAESGPGGAGPGAPGRG